MTANTLFMTEEESERIRQTVQNQVITCRAKAGQAREPRMPQDLIQQATGAALMQDFASAAFGLGETKDSSETMVAYSVGCAYPPCIKDLSELEDMNLSELRMDTHHRGQVLWLRRVSPVVQLKASSWAAVRGKSAGDVERLEVFLHNSRLGQDTLSLGDEFLVKEPYYTINSQGEVTIRIDHPSDLVISTYTEGPESWRETDKTPASKAKTAQKCKEEGNAALGNGNHAQAYSSYTEGLKLITDEDRIQGTLLNDIYRNRAYVNLLLQRYDEAKSDALFSITKRESQEEKSLDAKAYYRAGSAAYSLGDFEEAKGFFEKQQKLEPDNQLAKANLRRITIRLKERNGDYDLQRVVRTLSKTQGRADVANYTGHTEIKASPGAGRGLFATHDFKAKEIIMCEKAFCVVWGHEAEAFSALTCDLRDDATIRVFPAGLHKATMQKLTNSPSTMEAVLDLFGDYEGLGKKARKSDDIPVIDSFQLHDIVQRNGFGPGQQSEDEDISNASTGVWVRAAYINHSCISNAEKSYVGDLMILRASRDISKGEEISHTYDDSTDYDERRATLKKTWGFECHCALCEAEEADGPAVRKTRKELEKSAETLVRKGNINKLTISKVRRISQSLNETYDQKRYKNLPRRAVLGLQEWVRVASTS